MLPTQCAQAAVSGICYVLRLFVRYRSLWLMAVAMHIRSEMVLMSTSGPSVCRALPVARKPSFSLPYGHGCRPDRALPVLCKVVYRHDHATSD
jgi:hypothetical protein